MKWTFRIATGLLAASLVGGIALIVRPHPVEVDVARVVRAPLDQKVVDEGRARVRERYTVSAPVAGTLARIELHEGDVVEPGMVLARLLPLPSPLLDARSRDVAVQRLASAVDSQRQADATVTRAETADEQARRELARTDALAKDGTLSPAQLDLASADARMRAAELSSARFSEKVAAHDIEQARAALERFSPGSRPSEQFEITSPVRGQVLHVLHKSEGVVTPGTALLEVGDPRALELVVDVLSQDAVAVHAGMPARLLHWGAEPLLTAKVRLVEPSAFTKTSALGVDEQRVNVVLDPEGPPEHLASTRRRLRRRDRDHSVDEAGRAAGAGELSLPSGRGMGRLRGARWASRGPQRRGRSSRRVADGDTGRPDARRRRHHPPRRFRPRRGQGRVTVAVSVFTDATPGACDAPP